MSVQIEVLDYQYIKQNLVTWSNSSVNNWLLGTGVTAVANYSGSVGILISSTAGVSTPISGFSADPVTLINNHDYTVSFEISFLDDNNQSPSSFTVEGTGSGSSSYQAVSPQSLTVGTHSFTFTMDTSQNNNVGSMLFVFRLDNGNVAQKKLKIKNFKLVDDSIGEVLNMADSVIGELDVTDHSEFPLSLTFQISEIQKLTSTTGDYSKSFKIPATKNNNKILKNLYITNLDRESPATENKRCRITIGNLFSLTGVIKVTGVGGFGEDVSYYECVFYGNNLGWANGIEGKTLNDIEWGSDGEDLLYNKGQITNTWNDVDCDSSSSFIVYPITSYGDFNPDGDEGVIQLLEDVNTATGQGSTTVYYGHNNNNRWMNGGLPPSPDWRPAIWVKDTLEKIFAQTNNGSYTINSEFMDSDTFKRLVWLLPNFVYNDPDDRMNNNSIVSRFINGESNVTNTFSSVVPSSLPLQVTDDGIDRFFAAAVNYNDFTSFLTGSNRQVLDLTSDNMEVVLDEQSALSLSGNNVTIKEHGYYNITVDDIQVKVARAFADTASSQALGKVKVALNLECQTHSQTSVVIIDSKFLEIEVKNGNNTHVTKNDTPVFSGYEDIETIEFRRYFNEGDKIRLTMGVQIQQVLSGTSLSQDFVVYLFYRSNPEKTASFDIKLESKRVEYGQTYNLKNVIDPKYKQIDFVKGVAHAFNLKMTTDDVRKIITIEPASIFYKGFGEAADWTHKLDRAREIKDKFIKTDLKRNLIFKYKSDDNDATVKFRGDLYFDGVHDEYPYREDLSSKFEKGESIFENPFFAGTYNAKDRDTSRGLIGDPAYTSVLLTANTGAWTTIRPDKGYEFLPRLLYWNKYSPTITVTSGKQAFMTTGLPVIQVRAGGSVPSGSFNIYPQATSYDREKSSSPVLSYGNVMVSDYNDQAKTTSNPQPVKGLYETYYKPIFEMFKHSPRLRTAYIDLKVADIINLDFRKLVHIDGVYYILNKIIDYMPNKNQPTKVELAEWVELGGELASTPPIGAGINGIYDDEISLSTKSTSNNYHQGI
tara:strand:+ start:2415 stop:5546 length:3132 start_codon:yes stop_codon:yes gene_type:complete